MNISEKHQYHYSVMACTKSELRQQFGAAAAQHIFENSVAFCKRADFIYCKICNKYVDLWHLRSRCHQTRIQHLEWYLENVVTEEGALVVENGILIMKYFIGILI